MAAILTHVNSAADALGALLLRASLRRFNLDLVLLCGPGGRHPLVRDALRVAVTYAAQLDDGPPPACLQRLVQFPAGLYLAPNHVAIADLRPTVAVIDARCGLFVHEVEADWGEKIPDDPAWGRVAGQRLLKRYNPQCFGWHGRQALDWLNAWRQIWESTDRNGARDEATLAAMAERQPLALQPGLLVPAPRRWGEIVEDDQGGPALVYAGLNGGPDRLDALACARAWDTPPAWIDAMERMLALLAMGGAVPADAAAG